MANYKVIALSVGGKGNKIYKSGDVVTEKHFPDGNINSLIKGGFLQPCDEESKMNVPVTEPEQPEVNYTEETGNESKEEFDPGKAKKEFNDISIIELQEYLTEKGIEFRADENKKNLYKLYKKN